MVVISPISVTELSINPASMSICDEFATCQTWKPLSEAFAEFTLLESIQLTFVQPVR